MSPQPQPQPQTASASAPSPTGGTSLPLGQASHLLTTFVHFLTVCVHNILYYRGVYPAATFLTSRAYNLPVHQSRHPRVCAWVRDALDAVRAQLVRGAVERVVVVLHAPPSASPNAAAVVLERWVFDVAGFPAWSGLKEDSAAQRREFQYHHEDDDGGGGGGDESGDGRTSAEGAGARINWPNVHEELRAAIRKLAYAGEQLAALPDGCTFTIAVELREEAEAPIGVRKMK